MQAKPQATLQPISPKSKAQRGFVAVLLLVMMAMAATAALTVNLWGGGEAKAYEQKVTREALQKAKEALLAYVETGDSADITTLLDGIAGRLPCPDNSGDGKSDTSCGIKNVNRLGLLPWHTLKIPMLRDSSGECLWYVVSGNAKANPESEPLNSDALGQLTVVQTLAEAPTSPRLLAGGVVSANRAMAVVIAPGKPRAGQVRTPTASATNPCPLPTTSALTSAVHYLDSFSINSTTTGSNDIGTPAALAESVIANADTGQVLLNDQVISITADEFAQRATNRTAQILRFGLEKYKKANGSYPNPAKTPGGSCDTATPPINKGFMPLTCGSIPAPPISFDPLNCDITFSVADGLELGKRLNTKFKKNSATKYCTTLDTAANVDQWFNQTHYAMGAGLTVDGVAVKAVLLLRGRTRPEQRAPAVPACALVAPLPAVATTQADVATCVEGANAVLITGAGTAYTTPNRATSNDLLISFK